MPDGPLFGEVVPVRAITPDLAERLWALYAAHYDGADPDRFRADLAEKGWVLLLREGGAGTPVGFSTQMLIDVRVEDRTVRALFSGDTIIHRDWWGTQELVRTWCRFAGQILRAHGDAPLYWFLISKGYRTYLYLPFFFEAFYPRHDRPTPPFEQRLIEMLGSVRYGAAFDPRTGLIEHPGVHDRVREELDTTEQRRRNPDVDFFVRRNPRYAEGVELVCVAEIAPENLHGAARRALEIGMREAGELPPA